ncbi:histone-lysine N-methyltransferase ATXR4 [Lotus japonicus]|uniref:histone-lysine N-methyltransferase ATXR4 n=1 Tax=Lotus japonicus TaxID=34305 RepID=UPI00258C59B3|nr:histone-lysine N-methyltransferase ATXR4 [Lotus japonicus]
MAVTRSLPLRLAISHFTKPFHHFSFSTSTTAPPQHPPPIRVALTDSVGRAVFATRPIPSGDLIHTAQPAVCHPSPSAVHSVCYSCLASLSSSIPQCTPFCSHHCHQRSKDYYDVEMKANWMDFDNYCRTRGLKYPFMVKRLACMVVSGVSKSDSLDILQPANLTPEMILEMEEEFSLLRSAFTKALIADEHIAFLTKQWYINVLARIRINAFRIELAGGLYEDLLASAVASVEAEAAVGNAVYMLPSFYNHDCDPNAHIIWIDNADAKLKALRDIDEGEELRICYIDASLDRDARRELLFRGFGFQCNCSRCLHGD